MVGNSSHDTEMIVSVGAAGHCDMNIKKLTMGGKKVNFWFHVLYLTCQPAATEHLPYSLLILSWLNSEEQGIGDL